MRWDPQRLDAAGMPATLPGMPTMRGLLRSVQVPEFPGLTFHEVRSESALNEVPDDSIDRPLSPTVRRHHDVLHRR